MNILGFDTAQATTSACVERDDGEVFEIVPEPAKLFEPPAHGRELLPALETLRDKAGLDWSEIDVLAVGRGPGTYTGLRVGIATARALAYARGIQLRGVSSLAALAEQITAPLRLAVLDAKRGELFCALYRDSGEVWPELVARPEDVADRARQLDLTPVAAGDGSLRFRRVLEAAGVWVVPDRGQEHVVRGLSVCRLARHVTPVTPQQLVPSYLRAVDARPAQ